MNLDHNITNRRSRGAFAMSDSTDRTHHEFHQIPPTLLDQPFSSPHFSLIRSALPPPPEKSSVPTHRPGRCCGMFGYSQLHLALYMFNKLSKQFFVIFCRQNDRYKGFIE